MQGRPFGRSLFGGGLGLDNNLRVESIDYQARIVFTAGSTTYRLSTTSLYRDSNWHDPALLIDGLEPEEAFPDDFGIVDGDEVEAAIVGDYASLMEEDLDGTSAELEILSILHRSDGSTLTQGHPRTYTIQGLSSDPGEVRLRLETLENVKLDQVYPSATYTVDDYSELLETDVGKPTCKVIGLGIKTPGTIIKTGGGTGPWIVAFCETGPAAVKATGSEDGILTVYRNNRVLDSSEYSVTTDTSGSTDVLCISFTDEADVIDFQGNWYEFAADIRDTTSVSRNVGTEIERLLGEASLTVDSDSITAAEAHATDEDMWVDYVYGRDGQRTYKAHLEDLLFLARGGLKRTASGSYELFQDKEGGSATRYDETAGHPVEFSNYERPPRHTSIALSYKPSIQDTDRLRHTITRSVTGGTLGDKKPRELPQVMDHTTAGKLCDYLAKREQHNRRVDVYTAQDQFNPTRLIGGKCAIWSGEKLWKVWTSSMVPAGSSCTLIEYDPSMYSTSAGTPPADATTGYQPDFSNTPPEAPTITVDSSGDIESSGAGINDDGTVLSWATVSATPPAQNFQRIIFQAENDSTSEITTQEGSSDSSGDWSTTFANLRPNENYTIYAFARNAFGIDGDVDSVSHSTATDVGNPDAPSNITLTQGPSQTIWVTWDKPNATDVHHYVLERDIGATGAWDVVDDDLAATSKNVYVGSYVDIQFRVKAVDNSGNESAYNTSSTTNMARNIGSQDLEDGAAITSRIGVGAVETDRIADDDVTTDKRQGVNFVSGSGTLGSTGNVFRNTLSINESKEPTGNGSTVSETSDYFSIVGSISTTTIVHIGWVASGGTAPGPTIISARYW